MSFILMLAGYVISIVVGAKVAAHVGVLGLYIASIVLMGVGLVLREIEKAFRE